MRGRIGVLALGVLFSLSSLADEPRLGSTPNVVRSETYFAAQVTTGPFDNSDHARVCVDQKAQWSGRLRNARLISLDCSVTDETRIDQSRQLVSGKLSFILVLDRPIQRSPVSVEVPKEMGYLNADVDQAIDSVYLRWSGNPEYVLLRWKSPESDVFPDSVTGELWLAVP